MSHPLGWGNGGKNQSSNSYGIAKALYSQSNIKKEKVGGLICLNFKTYYITT